MSAPAMQTAAGFVQQLAVDLTTGNLELPMLPDSVLRIISSDPAIAARVLQLDTDPPWLTGLREIAGARGRTAIQKPGHCQARDSRPG